MTTDQLKRKGFSLLRDKPFAVITQKTRATLIITLDYRAGASGRYFEAMDKAGNILLIREDNLELS